MVHTITMIIFNPRYCLGSFFGGSTKPHSLQLSFCCTWAALFIVLFFRHSLVLSNKDDGLVVLVPNILNARCLVAAGKHRRYRTVAQWDEIPISWPKVKFLSFIFSSFQVQILFTDSPRTKFRTGQVYTCSRVAWASVDI